MIPTPHLWRVTFHLDHKTAAALKLPEDKVVAEVLCVKRFAKAFANEQCAYIAYFSKKITVGLLRPRYLYN
jgi:hypothetical protein